MSDPQQLTVEQYRETAEEIRLAAQRTHSPEIREQYSTSLERDERMAACQTTTLQPDPVGLSVHHFRRSCARHSRLGYSPSHTNVGSKRSGKGS